MSETTPSTEDKRVVNIDGDPIVYAVGFASEQKRFRTPDDKLFEEEADADRYVGKYYDQLLADYFPEEDDGFDLWSFIEEVKVQEPLEFVLSSVKRMIADIVAKTEADEYYVWLTGVDNFRDEVATIQPYKGHREGAPKPFFYQQIRDYIIDHQNGVVINGCEADDMLSLGAVMHGHVIATIDKDLDNTPGEHYNWQKKELYNVSPVEADRNFYCQIITGDPTDNIPGLYRVTGVRAHAKFKAKVNACTTPAEMYAAVVGVYNEAKKQNDLDDLDVEATILEIGRLLWMARDPNDYLWEAPQ
jgi:hypothetical protein